MSKNLSQAGQLETPQRGDTASIRVGELLVEAGIVNSAEMTEAIQVSKRLGVPIGRVLTMSGCVRESVMEAALQVQQLLRRDEVPLPAAVNALARVHQLKVGLADALAEEDLKPDLENDPHKLAALLVDSNIVSAEEMERAVHLSVEQGVPLGSTLVMQGFLSEAVLPSLVRIQRQIADGNLHRDEGLKEIQETFVLWVKADESLHKPLHDEPKSKASQPAAEERLEAPEAVAPPPQPQPQVQSPAPVPATAPVSQEKARLNDDPSLVRLVDLLKQSGMFSQADVQKRYDAMLKDPVRSAKFFIELGLLDEEEAKGAIRTHSLLQRGMLTKEEATVALKDSGSGHYNDLSPESSEKVRRYMDKRWRGQMSKVLGGALLGAVVAGFTISKRK